ncbi:hypothetical protein ACFX14_017785 [Malus domestica]
MEGMSKGIMGATLVMVVTVLGLILVLLAELYCSLLLCRRQHKPTATPTPSLTLQRPPQPLLICPQHSSLKTTQPALLSAAS